jgi:hypothetical protein
VVILDSEVEDLEDENHNELDNFNTSSSSNKKDVVIAVIIKQAIRKKIVRILKTM